jgi:hypothetical protein
MFPERRKEFPTGTQLLTFVSSDQALSVELERRAAALSSMQGEFDHSGLVGQLTKRIDLSNYDALLGSVVKLRNNAQYTTFVLRRLAEMNRRLTFEKQDVVVSLVKGMLVDYAKIVPRIATEIDESLVNELVSGPNSSFEDFTLITPSGQGGYINKFWKLYLDAITIPVTGYNSWPDFPAQRNAISKGYRSLAMARLEVVDTIFSMFHAPSFWTQIFPGDKVADTLQTAARRSSLSMLAGLMHNLLNRELFFAVGVLEHTRDVIHDWLGDLPSDIMPGFDAVDKYITPADALGGVASGKSFAARHTEMLASGAPNIRACLTDIASINGWVDISDTLVAASDEVKGLDPITDIRTFMSPTVSMFTQSTPIAQSSVLQDLHAQINFTSSLRATLTTIAGYLKGMPSEFASPTVITALKQLKLPTSLGQGGPVRWYPEVEAAGHKGYDGTTLSLCYSQPGGSALTDQLYNTKGLMTIAPSFQLMRRFPKNIGHNGFIADQLRPYLNPQGWKTLGLGSMGAPGARVYHRSEWDTSSHLLELLAELTQRPAYTWVSDFQHLSFRAAVVNAMSSWLCFSVPKSGAASGGTRTSNRSEGRAVAMDGGKFRQLMPQGHPYGLDAREWLNLFDLTQGIVLSDGELYAHVISKVAHPQTEMRLARISRDIAYRYWRGTIIEMPSASELLFEAKETNFYDISLQRSRVTPFINEDGVGRVFSSDEVERGTLDPDAGEVKLQYLSVLPSLAHYACMPAHVVASDTGTPGSKLVTYAPVNQQSPSVMGEGGLCFDGGYFYAMGSISMSINPVARPKFQNNSSEQVAVKRLSWPHMRDSLPTTLVGLGSEIDAALGISVDNAVLERATATAERMDSLQARVKKATQDGVDAPRRAANDVSHIGDLVTDKVTAGHPETKAADHEMSSGGGKRKKKKGKDFKVAIPVSSKQAQAESAKDGDA